MKQQTTNFANTKEFNHFWTQGNGAQLQQWSGAKLSLDTIDDWLPYKYQCDTLGDFVVSNFFLNRKFGEAFRDFENILQNKIERNRTLPQSINNLLQQTENVPEWVDWELIEMGASLCRRAGLNSLISLRDYSLMGGYDFAYLNKPLIHTGALKKGAVKRLADTLEFWVSVTRKDALRKGNRGYISCLKTRIIHSYSRIMILDRIKAWDTEKWGLPINTWDMCATYIGFSLVFLHGLQKLGINISTEEEIGHFHLWKYIGYLIGIPTELLPNNKKEATEQFYLWTSQQPSADEDSALLAQSLLDENLESTIFKYQFQRKNLRYLHICMNWFLLDKEVNHRLKIPKVPFTLAFPTTLILRNKIFQQIFSRNYQVKYGGNAQEKVLQQYLETAPRNTHQ